MRWHLQAAVMCKQFGRHGLPGGKAALHEMLHDDVVGPLLVDIFGAARPAAEQDNPFAPKAGGAAASRRSSSVDGDDSGGPRSRAPAPRGCGRRATTS